jgi:anti-anti-sigma regulatory factor
VVHFTGCNVSLDHEAPEHIHDRLFALTDGPWDSDSHLDFGNVKYVTATRIGILVGLHKKLLANGRHLTVGNLSPQVYEIFSAVRLDTFLYQESADPCYFPCKKYTCGGPSHRRACEELRRKRMKIV